MLVKELKIDGHTFSRVNETEQIERKTQKRTLRIQKEDEDGDLTEEEDLKGSEL